MRKNIILIILLIILILSESIIIILQHNTNNEEPLTSTPSWDKVSVSIKDGSLTPSGTTLIIENTNTIPTNIELFILPYNYYIDKNIDGTWAPLPEGSYYIPSEFTIDYKSNAQKILNWETRYGELETGQYRLRFELKTYNNIPYSTTKTIEFTL